MGKGPKVPQSSVDTQVGLQKTEADLLSKYSSLALPGIKNATDYWSSIMKGGLAAQQAVAPYAQQIQANNAATARTVQNTMPAGGERNLALDRLPVQTSAQIANLYAGLQPQAASMLGNLGLGTAQAGTGSGGVSSSAGASNEQLAASQAQAKAQMFAGIGQGVGELAGGYLGGPGFAASKAGK
jgi:hypothetical protein